MTTVPTEAQLRNLNDKECDDLTVFNQIKLPRQQWLRKSLDVCTYADLAVLSVDQIASQAKADNLILAREWIEEWIAEAQKLAAAADLTSRRTVEAANRTAKGNSTAAQEPGEWRRFAAFVVDFQARGVEDQKEELRIEVRHYPMDEKGSWLDNHGPLAVEAVRGGKISTRGCWISWAREHNSLPTRNRKRRKNLVLVLHRRPQHHR